MTDSNNSHESAYIEEEYTTLKDGTRGGCQRDDSTPQPGGNGASLSTAGSRGDKGDTVSEMSDDSIGTFRYKNSQCMTLCRVTIKAGVV